MTKAALRHLILARRDLITPVQAAEAADAVAERGVSLAREFAAVGAVVAAFWSVRREIPTHPLLEGLAGAGFVTALPVTQSGGAPLVFKHWAPGEALQRGALGNKEPGEGAAIVTPVVVFVPLAAFDRQGARIGYGGGHYDRTLSALRQAPAASGRGIVAIGVAYDLQEVEAIPLEAHDQRLDYVVTPTRTLATGAG